MAKLTIGDVDVQGRKVLVRVDFNVPLDEQCNITDDTRIRAALPTIRYILDNGGKAILMSHLGRPKGKVVESLRMNPVAKRLSELLGLTVKKMDDCIGSEVNNAISTMSNGDVVLLENLRFHAEETAGDEDFAKELASSADIYIDDAFGTAHRAHASMVGVTHYIAESAAGYLLEKEIRYLSGVVEKPKKPFIAILGGAKVSDKIPVIENLLDKVDCLLIGGAMAYTFLKAQNIAVGLSRVEEDKLEICQKLLSDAKEKNTELLLPQDHVIADAFKNDANRMVTDNSETPDGWMGLDIGPNTIVTYAHRIRKACTVLWNGPMGVFEMSNFAGGTEGVARALADSASVSIVGGGDSVSAINKLGLADFVTHVSTGGGASLEYLEGKVLPGVAALTDKN
ncbi:MAG: phosphoglycerate kinase [Candidatus Theseobacter exili]|nr:phosphoglycerate kinase [Candidatus Theseobacter exili]